MKKDILDYSVKLFKVGVQMQITRDLGKVPYAIMAMPYLAKPTKSGFVLTDGKQVNKKDLLVFKNQGSELNPVVKGFCLEADVEFAPESPHG